jgi:hypothetical protein
MARRLLFFFFFFFFFCKDAYEEMEIITKLAMEEGLDSERGSTSHHHSIQHYTIVAI